MERRASPASRRLHLPLRRSRRSCSLAAFVCSCVRWVEIVWAQHKAIVLRTTIDSGFCESWWDGSGGMAEILKPCHTMSIPTRLSFPTSENSVRAKFTHSPAPIGLQPPYRVARPMGIMRKSGKSDITLQGSRSQPGSLMGVGPGLCRISYMNFRELRLAELQRIPFHALG